MAEANNLFKQQTSKFLHGVRGLVTVNDAVAGAVQNVNATESADADLVRVMGSRYIQGKELKDKVVNGTIETLVFDPESQLLLKYTEPVAGSTSQGEETGAGANTQPGIPRTSDLDTPLNYDSTRILTDEQEDFSLMPLFDLECRSKVLSDDGNSASYYGFTIRNCMIVSYELRMAMNQFWLANVEFVADKIDRVSADNTQSNEN